MTEHGGGQDPWSILGRGAGRWAGEESMPAGAWAPGGLRSRGRMDARLVLGGRGLSSDYVQEADGGSLVSHTLIRWDAADRRFVMHFVPAAGGESTMLAGRREDDRLVFQGEGAAGPMRQTLRYGHDVLEVTSAAPTGEEGGWSVVFEGRYRRVAGQGSDGADRSGGGGRDVAGAGSPPRPVPGSIGWCDLTVEDAGRLRDFYSAVVGWTAREVAMGSYADYEMLAGDGSAAAGVCHARGVNAGLPPVWLVYVRVDDMERAVAEVQARGGELVAPVRSMGQGRLAVIRDPAGAVLALYREPS